MAIKYQFILTIVCLYPLVSYSHGGRTDSNGGHNNRKTGEYHCHQEPCFSRNKVSNATEEATVQGVAFSYVYNRSDWKHWSDLDGDCINTRHEILKSSSSVKATMSSNGCNVVKGQWAGLYSGKTYTNPNDLDIDHVIPLKWAHEHGGANWTSTQKELFANDARNLLAVDDGLNQAKGAKGPTEWMPPNQAYRCTYLTLWGDLLTIYSSLKMTASENRIFNKQIKACQ